VRAFRSRTASPKSGQGRFVQGNYKGHLSNWGETINLLDRAGRIVTTLAYAGNPSEQQRFLRITEIMYNPAPGGTLDNDEYEFLEIENTGTASLKLDGAKLTKGVFYTFPPTGNLSLAPGACIVIVKNRTAFTSRYSSPSIRLAPGVYTGSLDNAGETIKLEDPTSNTILEFRYEDRWYKTTDGLGYSLTIKDPTNVNLDSWGDADAWRSSPQPGGSPGTP
jgi:hypothetical protein